MTSFSELGLPIPIVHELGRQSITTAFPIQAATIPDVLAGRDVLGRGPTGSGKTFSFGLPMITRLANSPSLPGNPRGLVLVPTRELADQVAERLDTPAAAMGLRVLSVVGGVPIKRHITALASPVDILVATPGRAQDLINQKHLRLDAVSITALDEADQMADMGFLPQVTRLLRLTPDDGQRLLFSATLDGDVQKLVDEFLHDPATHSTAPVEAAVETMEHFLFHVETREDRGEVASYIAARKGKTIMFMRTKHAVDRQVRKLRRAGIHAVGMHGNKGQNTRTAALDAFARGEVSVLVATDIAARGIDIADVSLVVHIDPPAEAKAYLHRAGRTARAGEAGRVVTLVLPEQEKDTAKLLRAAGVDATEYYVTAQSPELVRITGARRPNNKPLAAFRRSEPSPSGAPTSTEHKGSGQRQQRTKLAEHRGERSERDRKRSRRRVEKHRTQGGFSSRGGSRGTTL